MRFPPSPRDLPRRRAVLAALLGFGATLCVGGAVALADPPKTGRAPDPPAVPNRKQWVFDIRVFDGAITVAHVEPVRVSKPFGTARVMGRYALELYIGNELLDRIRFDAPLTGDGPPERDSKRPFARPTFDRVRTRVMVQMADAPRATYVVVVDRAKDTAQRFWWPPEESGKLVPMSTTTSVATAVDGGVAADRAPAADAGSAPKNGDADPTRR
jgi:hypothetical protein